MSEQTADDERPWPWIFGKEMRGGLRDGHQHMAVISEPDQRCSACRLWAIERQAVLELTRMAEEDGFYGEQSDGTAS